jgi:hypothetical protein
MTAVFHSIGHLADQQFLEVPDFRNVTLKCLSEIGGLNVGPEYDGKFVTLFQVVMTSINRMVPPSTGTYLFHSREINDI